MSSQDAVVNNVISIILGGGQGTRLYPLTKERSKPAVPLAGKYRLIDIPISNCLNSGLDKIYVLTQFNSTSLHRHIARTYNKFGSFSKGFVEVLAANQTTDSMDWYQGTADAVRQNLRFFNLPNVNLALILSGDQLYRMDYQELIREHIRSNAEVTVSVLPVERKDARHFGILKAGEDGRIVDFFEKPKDEKIVDSYSLSPSAFERHGVKAAGRSLLASMGIYLFNLDVLGDVLRESNKPDFGKDIIPEIIKKRRVCAYFFDDYWEDIGTIKSFYEANLNLASLNPSFNFLSENATIYTNPLFLPGSVVNLCKINQSILTDGCIIAGAEIARSIIGIRSIIGKDTIIKDSIIMGADYYEAESNLQSNQLKKIPNMGIGCNSRIIGAIIDKNVHIGDNVTICNTNRLEHFDAENYVIRESIVIVPKRSVIPSNTVI